MTRRILAIAILILAATSAHARTGWLRERLYRNAYVATGRSPEGWAPRESLCPAFERNGWTDHPQNAMCWKPTPEVKAKNAAKAAKKGEMR